MRPLRSIIVDDEPLARDYLSSLLEEHPYAECVDTCQNGREAIRSIQKHRPDLVFLDVEMPGMSGFDVVKSLQSDTMPMIIFATAFDAYAVDAFDVQAVDYILKPFNPERVYQALSRAESRHSSETKKEKNQLLAAMELMNQHSQKAEPALFDQQPKRLTIKEHDEITLVPFDDIDWIDAAGDYMCVHVGNKTHVLRCTMKELEVKLKGTPLVRIHRSTVANLDKVQSIKPLQKGESELHLSENIILKVSRGYKNNVQSLK
jgi:two-component system LytT family response regulator